MLGLPDRAHAALPQLLQQPVATREQRAVLASDRHQASLSNQDGPCQHSNDQKRPPLAGRVSGALGEDGSVANCRSSAGGGFTYTRCLLEACGAPLSSGTP